MLWLHLTQVQSNLIQRLGQLRVILTKAVGQEDHLRHMAGTCLWIELVRTRAISWGVLLNMTTQEKKNNFCHYLIPVDE